MKALASLVLFFSANAFAAYTTTSEFQHQTNRGVLEVTPLFEGGATEYKASAGNVTNGLIALRAAVEYGISDMVSVGALWGYEKDDYSGGNSNLKGDGMIDPHVFLNGRADFGSEGRLRYGLDFRFSPANQAIGFSSDGRSFHQYSGGLTFTPYLGYEYAFAGKHLVGARMSYDAIQTDRKTDIPTANADLKLAGGNLLAFTVFYEMTLNPVVWGVDFGIKHYLKTTSKVTAGPVSQDSDLVDSYDTIRANAYLAYTFAPNFTLIPRVGYDTPDLGARYASLYGASVGSSGGFDGDLALRMAF